MSVVTAVQGSFRAPGPPRLSGGAASPVLQQHLRAHMLNSPLKSPSVPRLLGTFRTDFGDEDSPTVMPLSALHDQEAPPFGRVANAFQSRNKPYPDPACPRTKPPLPWSRVIGLPFLVGFDLWSYRRGSDLGTLFRLLQDPPALFEQEVTRWLPELRYS